jgi:hypothetical protein
MGGTKGEDVYISFVFEHPKEKNMSLESLTLLEISEKVSKLTNVITSINESLLPYQNAHPFQLEWRHVCQSMINTQSSVQNVQHDWLWLIESVMTRVSENVQRFSEAQITGVQLHKALYEERLILEQLYRDWATAYSKNPNVLLPEPLTVESVVLPNIQIISEEFQQRFNNRVPDIPIPTFLTDIASYRTSDKILNLLPPRTEVMDDMKALVLYDDLIEKIAIFKNGERESLFQIDVCLSTIKNAVTSIQSEWVTLERKKHQINSDLNCYWQDLCNIISEWNMTISSVQVNVRRGEGEELEEAVEQQKSSVIDSEMHFFESSGNIVSFASPRAVFTQQEEEAF